MKPSEVQPSKCCGFQLGSEVRSYSKRDVILYALGLGLSQDQLDANDLQYTYENSDGFAPLPSFAVVLPRGEVVFESLSKCPGMPDFNPMMLLHGEQKVELFKPLQTDDTLTHTASLKEVWDKGKAALVVVETQSRDQQGDLVCVNTSQLFIRGIGGFGGPKQPKGPARTPPNRPPDVVFTKATSPNQALIYRLSGDYNPLHADPNFSSIGGFDVPILHGLCTFGIAGHGVVREMCDNDASRVRSIEGRFASTVVPGDVLAVEMWRQGGGNGDGGRVVFQVKNLNSGKVALSNGLIVLHTDNPRAAL
ncbi:unnamed protein product [Vitrella brassicaformis CCMP3155]|uniref:MaoC-like domain-containing protein n=1 Tax=Vitrella brassicaformis (strain CCMP3155) TaxID=1169540 RepID=A0A0G4EWY7_VITBC|nr:unnamed protein product [Vitrella brassicaformis CCMP3155]|eukprot:CEM02879.1 unnamed protein product [Vitrella brassicaformis CCMP3155]